uniref:Elongation factor 1 beta central acidic region eukaryote domain-containing protein n=1 Tax=Romanomermis culicivorax TaxID=13658 RepID=A0A915K490_ROMCU
MAKFSDLKSSTGLKELNHHLELRSYIDGFVPSELDIATLDQLKGAPGSEFPNVLRWYNHIKSFSAEEKKHAFGKASTSAAAGDAAKPSADEDFDLFADDDEEDDAEKERVKQERLKAYEEKKSKKPALIAKSSIILDIKPWDDECDLKEIEKQVRAIQCDGLLWSKE